MDIDDKQLKNSGSFANSYKPIQDPSQSNIRQSNYGLVHNEIRISGGVPKMAKRESRNASSIIEESSPLSSKTNGFQKIQISSTRHEVSNKIRANKLREVPKTDSVIIDEKKEVQKSKVGISEEENFQKISDEYSISKSPKVEPRVLLKSKVRNDFEEEENEQKKFKVISKVDSQVSESSSLKYSKPAEPKKYEPQRQSELLPPLKKQRKIRADMFEKQPQLQLQKIQMSGMERIFKHM